MWWSEKMSVWPVTACQANEDGSGLLARAPHYRAWKTDESAHPEKEKEREKEHISFIFTPACKRPQGCRIVQTCERAHACERRFSRWQLALLLRYLIRSMPTACIHNRLSGENAKIPRYQAANKGSDADTPPVRAPHNKCIAASRSRLC